MNTDDNLKCGYCHNLMDKSQNCCENCGKKIKKVKPKRISCLGIRNNKPCAKRLKNETKFCPDCGTPNPNHAAVVEQTSCEPDKENSVDNGSKKSSEDKYVLQDMCEQSVSNEHNFDEAQKENAVDKCSKKISEDGDILKDSIGQPESNVKEQTSFKSEEENSVKNDSKKNSEDENVLQDMCGQSVSNEHNFVEPRKENTLEKCSKKSSEDSDILHDTIGKPESHVDEQTSFKSEKDNSIKNESKKNSEDENVLQVMCGQSVSNEHNVVEPQTENAVDECSNKSSADSDTLHDTIEQPESNGSVDYVSIGIGDAFADDMVEEFFDIGIFKDALLRKLKFGGVDSYATFLIEQINWLKEVKVKVAVAGESGTGKSAFINAIRGVRYGDKDYAEVGCGNTTMEVNTYAHPKNRHILLYDLPGYNTTKKTFESFLKEVNLSDFDIFLIFFTDIPTIADAWLVDKLRSTDTKCCIIRTKVDEDIENEDQTDEVLSGIKEYVKSSIEKFEGLTILRSAKLFHISSFRPNIGEMDDLIHFLKDEVSPAKYEAIILSIPTVTKEIIEKKYIGLKRRVWLTAIAFSLLYPNMYKVEKNLREEIIMYYRVFELDKDLAATIPNLNHHYIIDKHLQDFTLGARHMLSVGHRYRFCRNFMLNLLNGLREDADTMYAHIVKKQGPSQSN